MDKMELLNTAFNKYNRGIHVYCQVIVLERMSLQEETRA